MAPIALPERAGDRPQTSTSIPHKQLDQQPADPSLTATIIDEARSWPHVVERESLISVEGARGLLLDGAGGGRPDAFMVSSEFCHAHAQGDHSFHAALPPELAAEAERAGWAEPHFLARTGQIPSTIVMIYAPRDDAERAVVLGLVRASYEFALSEATEPAG